MIHDNKTDGLGHWGDSKHGHYYNGIHHDDLLKSGKLGIESESFVCVRP